MLARLKQWARDVKRDIYAIYLAVRDPRTPWPAKVVGGAIIAYALSPIDLIPDFIPVLGYLDDLIILPLGLMLVRRMIPPALLAEYRATADARPDRPRSVVGAVIIVCIWALIVGWLATRFF